MNRYLSADLIHDGHQYSNNDTLVIDDKGAIVDLISRQEVDGGNIEKFHGILCPGFVNTHCHTELSFMKGFIPEYTGLASFIQAVRENRSKFSEVEKSIAIAEAIEEMHENGIVAVGDICNTFDSFEAKKNSSLYFHNFLEVFGVDPLQAKENFQKIKELRDATDILNLPNCKNTITAHAAYSTSPDLINMAIAENPDILSVHNQESIAENQLFEKGTGELIKFYEKIGVDLKLFFEVTGKSALQSSLPWLEKVKNLLLVHNTFLDEKDLSVLHSERQENFHLVLCPKANLYIENTLPDFYLLFENESDNICLGTDSLASNDSLSILSEIQTLMDHESRLDLEQCLTMATYHGATALGISDQYGSFVKGKKPGVLLIENEKNVQRLV